MSLVSLIFRSEAECDPRLGTEAGCEGLMSSVSFKLSYVLHIISCQ